MDVQKTDIVFFFVTLCLARRFGLNGMRSLSKPGAIMYPFEPQLSLKLASHGKSALLVCLKGACKATNKANFLIGGG